VEDVVSKVLLTKKQAELW